MTTVTIVRSYEYRDEGFGGTTDPRCCVCHKSMRETFTYIVRAIREGQSPLKREIHSRCLDRFGRIRYVSAG